MENLIVQVTQAVSNLDIQGIQNIFGPSGSWNSIGQGEQRSLSAHLISTATANEQLMTSDYIEKLLDIYLETLQTLPASVENAADNTLRQKLFEYYCESSEYSQAARVLATTRMEDSGVYQLSAVQKTDLFVKIAECFLMEDEIAESDSAVNKAGIFVSQISDLENHQTLYLRYKSTFARVLDKNRKFLNAASRYHELSQIESSDIDSDELLQFLGRAATCAILARSGPQRQRILNKIAKDPRIHQLDSLAEFSTHSTILKKMRFHQIIKADELQVFKETLQDHQKAIMGDGLTILERGIVEHNMTAVMQYYKSIYFSELAVILGVDAAKAESIAASMINDNSLPNGCIDQLEGLLEFEENDDGEEVFDRGVTDFCMHLNSVAGSLKTSPASN